MLNWFLEPLRSEFMVNAIIVGILMGILCAVVGSYMIVQQMGMMSHAISHSILPGLPIAYVMGVSLSLGAFIAGVISALGLAWIESQSRLKLDTAMAIILSIFTALGVTLLKVLPGANKLDLMDILFGNILGVNEDDMKMTLITTLIVLALVVLFFKELLYYTFDPLGAQADGMPVHFYYLGLVVAMTIAVVVSLQTVGAALVIAMLIGPPSTAYLLVRKLHIMMVLGSIIGVLSSVLGMYLSYHLDAPSGATIVLVTGSFFILAFLFSPSQGLLTRPELKESVSNIFPKNLKL
ncbi:ABC transporter permease [Dulcicalothrix desertica PCC 7102]|uniref:ABC transporter permease n=1 Tax=Dulcicalothrix desertica PCC 7102 TaxID=232991 RepID=A0A433VMW5_9CYAN|nr:metal ABC transporter permease [Dulcicalothrix desertica]RUT07382.1 ABC transporter permease [Dulcicalothrix desertica PCC 7102]TWH55425.1 manganese/iron transport system permease protein [Dulcicalothrix desertica PCC 7102]